MITPWWLTLALAVGAFFGFRLGRLYPMKSVIDAAWRAGWRASDGGLPPLNAEALAREKGS